MIGTNQSLTLFEVIPPVMGREEYRDDHTMIREDKEVGSIGAEQHLLRCSNTPKYGCDEIITKLQ